MMNQRKVGIMGGTFNPIHIGHLILAENAYEQFELDTVLFMPTKNPPHKNNDAILSEYHRVNMIKASIADNPHFELSTIELEREGTTYTADTLEYLKKINPDTQYYFIIGVDSLFEIETWKKPEVVFDLATILVATRYNLLKDTILEQINLLNKKYATNIKILKTPNIDLSSKRIRELVSQSATINYYVHSSVKQYIGENKLYQTPVVT